MNEITGYNAQATEYIAGIESCLRTIAGAPADNRATVFDLFAVEAYRYAARGEIAFGTVGDNLQEVADTTGLSAAIGQDAVQKKIASAIKVATQSSLTAPSTAPPTASPPVASDDYYPCEEHQPAPAQESLPLPFVSVAAWQDIPVDPQRWNAHYRTPMRATTLLSGDGAAGKTTIALQLCTATVRGTDWLGSVIDEPGPALFYTGEEEQTEIHRRIARINAHFGVTFADLTQLHCHCRPGEDAVLGAVDRSGTVRATPRFDELRQAALDIKPKLLVVESLADVFSGNENDRSQTRQFITIMRKLALDADAAVLLLGHPSLEGLRSGSGTSGSTGWNNSVRSRLYFSGVKGADEHDTGARTLQVMKSNYGPGGETIRVRWKDGVFVPDAGNGSLQRAATESEIEFAYLDCLDAAHASGRDVGPYTGRAYAPAIFEKMTQARGFNAKALAAAQERLFAAGTIQVVQVGPPSKARDRIIRKGCQ